MAKNKKINPNVTRKNTFFYHIKDTDMLDLVPFECGHETCECLKPKICTRYNYYSMHAVIAGRGYYLVDGKLHTITENQIFAFFPSEKIEYYPDPDTPWQYYWVNFVGAKAKVLMDLCGFTKKEPVYTFHSERIPVLFKKIATQENHLMRDILTISQLYEIIALIVEERRDGSLPLSEKQDKPDSAVQYISENYMNANLSVAQVAQKMGYDTKYFSRLFKQKVGMTFTTYVNRLRIMKACEYLEKTDMSLKEIAAMTGFTDPLYFSRRFSQLILSSPSRYRKLLHKNIKKLPLF